MPDGKTFRTQLLAIGALTMDQGRRSPSYQRVHFYNGHFSRKQLDLHRLSYHTIHGTRAHGAPFSGKDEQAGCSCIRNALH